MSAQPHPRYQVLEKIASGSFATVYRGRDQELGRDVAIKQIHDQFLENPKQLERYWQEAQLLASFQHPNIVTIYDIVKDRGWLIMELMQGNLAKVAGKKQLDLDSLRSTLGHALRALRFLHAHGIVHGDIKPSNMMIDRRKRIKIGDFGLARRVSDDDGSLIKGTTKYMAPEVVSDEFGDVGPASDLYSLGFVAYELMCGENFDSLFPGLSAFGRDRQIAWMMWHAAPDRKLPEITRVMEGVPEDLARVVQKLIAKPQAERYKNAEEALSDLKIDIRIVKGEMSEDGSMTLTSVAPAADPGKKRKLLLIGAFAASVMMSLLLFFGDSLFGPGNAEIPKGMGGIIREISVKENRLVLDDEEGVPQDLHVNKATRFWLADDEKFVQLRELLPGDRVQQMAKDQGANRLEVLRPKLNAGRISELDIPHSEFQLTIEEGEKRESVTLRVPKNANIKLNGRKAVLADLKSDDDVDVSHIRDPKGTAARLVVELIVKRAEKVVGFVIKVEGRRIVIEQREGRNVSKRELPLADDCVVSINGQTSPGAGQEDYEPASLKKEDRVEMEVDTHVASIAATRRAMHSGQITKIDFAAGQFTVKTTGGIEKPFSNSAETSLTLNQKPATFDDLRQYDTADVRFDAGNGVRPAATIDAVRPVRGGRLFAIITVQNYTDRQLSPLEYPEADGKLLKETLVNRYSCDPAQVLVLTDPTRTQLKDQLTDWFKRTTNATQLVVYFAGHAYKMDDGEVYLATKETKWSDVPGTGLKLSWLTGEIDSAVASEYLLLLDASHTGGGADLKREVSAEEIFGTLKPLQNLQLLGSCRQGERGNHWRAKEHGLFGWAVAEAFSGKADLDKNLMINSEELFDHLKKVMAEASAELQTTQTPVLVAP